MWVWIIVSLVRIGRSGRYGRKGVAINFVKNDDIRILRDIEQYYSTQIDEMPMNGESSFLLCRNVFVTWINEYNVIRMSRFNPDYRLSWTLVFQWPTWSEGWNTPAQLQFCFHLDLLFFISCNSFYLLFLCSLSVLRCDRSLCSCTSLGL